MPAKFSRKAEYPAEVQAQWRGRGCVSEPVVDLHAWDDAETTVEYPNAFANVKCATLPVRISPDYKDCFAGRA